MKKYEFLEHTADIKFRIFGRNLEEIFENCALAFSELIGRGSIINDKIKKNIEVSGKDNESLLYNFIEELIYLLDADGFVVSKCEVTILGNKLNALVYGDSVENYKNLDYVKAATYAEMYVREIKKEKWEAQVVVDV